VNLPDGYKMGTVGQVFPGSGVKLAEGGEILIKGPGVMEGYHNLPEETAKSLTDDGWLRTGDKGEVDAEGFLRITGRIKELFKTSGGKYIAPPAIESKFKAICPYASQFVVFGNERNFVVALITLDPDALGDWAKENGVSGDYAAIVSSDACHKLVQGYVEELNRRLNRWETIKKWQLLDHDLSVESGELTPSMKVKRNVVEQNYAGVIDAFYS
jgi:long-chain acyl-CoA synthetase